MFCPKCGQEVPDGAGFCKICGAPIAAPAAPVPPPAQYGQPQAPGGFVPQSYGGFDSGGSGGGAGTSTPPQAEGWTFAGFIPFGIFAFYNKMNVMGIVGIAAFLVFGWTFIVPLGYAIYIGISGKKLAWQSREFESAEQFEVTMKAWNMWGIILLIVCLIGSALSTCSMLAMGALSGLGSGMGGR